MSWNIELHRSACCHCGREVHEEVVSGLTYNLRPMIVAATWVGPRDLHGRKAEDVRRCIEPGLQDMVADPAWYRQYNPENGWGTYEGCVRVLTRLVELCREYPDATVEVT